MHTAAREFEQLGGYEYWLDKYEYNYRRNIEGYNSSTKRTFGECVRMHKKENCFKEAKMKFINNQKMHNYTKIKASA